MATEHTFVQYLVFVVSTVLVVQATHSPKIVTIDAATQDPTSPYSIFLYSNGEALVIPTKTHYKDWDYVEAYVFVDSNIQPDMNVTAAYASLGDSCSVRNYFGVTYRQDSKTIGQVDFGSDYDFIKGTGADAIAKRGDKVIFFKGCKMAARDANGTWEEPEDVKPLGLPCYSDAAWKEDNDVIILRGDQVWKWKEDGTVDGPSLFHQLYNITSWILKPYEAPHCPEGWHLYEDTKACYRVYKDKKNWVTARKTCKDLGGHLATVRDKSTFDFVKDLVKVDFAYYWLGLNDIKKEGTFVWLDETEAAPFTVWNTKEPNDYHGEDCVHITESTNFSWNDWGCEVKIGYICESPATE